MPGLRLVGRNRVHAIGTLASELAEPTFQIAFKASAGLCIPHFGKAKAGTMTVVARDLMRVRMLETEKLLHVQLSEIMREHDYRIQHELSGDEVGAAGCAVAHVSGFHGLTTT